LKVHVWPEAEQERVMDPVKFVPDADMGMFTEVEPTRVVVIGEEEVRLNWAVLVPERATVWGLPVALSEMLSAPLRAPLAVGAKVTLAVQLCPGLSRLFNGAAAHVLVWRKSPLVVIPVIVRTAVPVLVIVTVCGLLVVPTAWLENEKCLVLLGYSVESIERDHQIEFFSKRQTADVSPFKPEIAQNGGTEVVGRGGDHIRRCVDAYDSPFRKASGDLCRNFAVTATQIQHALCPFEIQKRQGFSGHSSLKFRYRGVFSCIPFGHLASRYRLSRFFQTPSRAGLLLLETSQPRLYRPSSMCRETASAYPRR